LRLHEYARVYALPGLYEEVVQRRLRCASPSKLAELLVRCAGGVSVAPGDLAVFDLGAGNGVVGEKLRARGVGTLVGSDSIPAARDAAQRDRPGRYAEYLVGDRSTTSRSSLAAGFEPDGVVNPTVNTPGCRIDGASRRRHPQEVRAGHSKGTSPHATQPCRPRRTLERAAS
jgi:hypothetical protein